MSQTAAQADYVFFLQNIFADGTLSWGYSAQQLLEALQKHKDYPKRMLTFLVTSREMLNELAPVEVLAGTRFPGHEHAPHMDVAAHNRILERKLEERVIKVIYAARDYFDGTQF